MCACQTGNTTAEHCRVQIEEALGARLSFLSPGKPCAATGSQGPINPRHLAQPIKRTQVRERCSSGGHEGMAGRVLALLLPVCCWHCRRCGWRVSVACHQCHGRRTANQRRCQWLRCSRCCLVQESSAKDFLHTHTHMYVCMYVCVYIYIFKSKCIL